MKRLIVCLLALLCSFLLAGGRTYSLEECLDMARACNKELEQAGYSLEIARQGYSQAELGFVPELSISNRYSWSDGEYDMGAAIEASAVLFAGFGRIHALKKAGMAVESGGYERELVERQLYSKVLELYIKLLMDKDLMSVCESRLSLLEQQQDLISRKLSLQAAVRSDMLGVQADISSAKVDRLEAEGDFNSNRISLCELLEIDDWNAFDVDKPDSITPLPYICGCSVESLPQLKLARLESEIAEREIEIAKASAWPEVQLNAGLQRQVSYSSYLSLTIAVPVSSLFAQTKNVRIRHLSHDVAQSKVAQTRLTLEKELKQAVAELDNVYEKYLLLLTEQEHYEMVVADVRRKYEYGAATYFDCQTAMMSLFQSQSRLLQSKYEYMLGVRLMELWYR